MKKVVLVIDHLERDLRGIVLIAYWLSKKWNIRPIITHTRNEISSLIKYKPDLILIQHVRHHWQKQYLQYAKSQNTAIAVSLAEGFPIDKEEYIFQAGRDEYVRLVDLFMTWGNQFNQAISGHNLTKKSTCVAVGSPRFDWHDDSYHKFFESQTSFYRTLGFSMKKPLITWLTDTIFANPKEGQDEFISNIKKPSSSASRLGTLIEPLVKDHQNVFNTLGSYMKKLCEDYPDVNFLIKVHPGEEIDTYRNYFEKVPNLTIVGGFSTSLTEILRYSDILINWRCTTGPEGWMVDLKKKTIGFELADPQTTTLQYLSEGNDVVTSYELLRKKISFYLDGGDTSLDLISHRKTFMDKYLCANDGRSSERCADAINEYITRHEAPKRSLYNAGVIFRNLHRYRFNKYWLYEKRDSTHPKYTPPQLVIDQMNQLIKLKGGIVDYVVEM